MSEKVVRDDDGCKDKQDDISVNGDFKIMREVMGDCGLLSTPHFANGSSGAPASIFPEP